MELVILKKIVRFSLIILLFGLITSCENNDFSTLTSKDSSLNSSILINGDISKINNPIELTGDFYIWNKNDEIIFYTRDDKKIHFFSCQGCESSMYTSEIKKEKGILTFLDHSFIFQNERNKEKFYFAVKKEEEKKIKDLFGLSFLDHHEYFANGIIHSIKDLSIEESENYSHSNVIKLIKNSQSLEDILNSLYGNNFEKSDCTSGGPGSTSCSSSSSSYSCSVSCGKGYYACCSNTGILCICIKEER